MTSGLTERQLLSGSEFQLVSYRVQMRLMSVVGQFAVCFTISIQSRGFCLLLPLLLVFLVGFIHFHHVWYLLPDSLFRNYHAVHLVSCARCA